MTARSASEGNVLGRLYRGETNFDLVGHRKRWYLASAIIILICLVSIVFRGFNIGIEFAGGNQYLLDVKPGTSLSQVRSAVESQGIEVSSAQTAGRGDAAKYVIRTEKLNPQSDASKINAVENALKQAGHVDTVNYSQVSSSWGKEITQKAIIALIVFLLVVSAFLWIRFKEARVAGAASLALLHDLLLTAGVYSIVGFEVTPGTVVGLLTILGYSLYDTVVVFDKVDENTKGVLGHTRYTYAEAANRAVNETLMRSINTSIIGLLPVAGLLFVGAGIFGVGTLEDLALVLFVGMLTGAYSSLFLATPWLVDFKMMDPRFKNQAKRVAARRAADLAKVQEVGKAAVAARKGEVDEDADAEVDEETDEDEDDVQSRIDALAGATPRPGVKPAARPTKRAPSRTSRPGTPKKRH
jgi:preprotein translocase subunit SecF